MGRWTHGNYWRTWRLIRYESLCRVGANQCGCPILDRFRQGKYISGAMRSNRRSKNCEKESEAMQKGKVITHQAVQLSLNCKWKISS
jgi:hypothetical protein